jgi:alpha-tubulin suppressor-like RCC1 family protein
MSRRVLLVCALIVQFTMVSLGSGAPASAADDPRCEPGQPGVIYGTESDDVLAGSWQDETICGLGGNDTISGGGGNDVLVGGPGDDTIDGSYGNDELVGGDGDDVLTTIGGTSSATGGPGNDTLVGGWGADTLTGGLGVDTADGSWDVDTCAAEQLFNCESAVADTFDPDQPIYTGDPRCGPGQLGVIYGTQGDDVLAGTWQDETICGLGGNDTISSGGGDDILIGGPGDDTVTGSYGADELVGGGGDDVLSTGGGASTALGGSGNDQLTGSWASDVLRGGPGVDVADGQGGNDTCAAETVVNCEETEADETDDPIAISGVVLDGGGEPIADAYVAILDAETGEPIAATFTGSSGGYVFNDIEPAAIIILFEADGYVSEYFDDAPAFVNAAVLELNPGDVIVADAALDAEAGAGSMTGQVVGGGDPILGAFVEVYTAAEPPVLIVSALTDEDGFFEIGGIPAGNVLVRVSAEGYVTQWVEGASDSSGAAPIPVNAGETTNISIGLEPELVPVGYTLVGRVSADEIPLEAANVTITDTDGAPVGSAITDIDGLWAAAFETTLSAVVIRFEADGYITEFWADAASFETADLITLAEVDEESFFGANLPPEVHGVDIWSELVSNGTADHNCATSDIGELYCWGRNNDGQLASGDRFNRAQPRVIGGEIDVAAGSVAVGGAHTCVLTTSSSPVCWGDNSAGQIGTGSFSPRDVLLPASVDTTSIPASQFIEIAAGDEHTCMLGADAWIYCFGQGSTVQLGVASEDSSAFPTPIEFWGVGPDDLPLEDVPNGFTAVAAGGNSSCAIGDDGEIYCWGAILNDTTFFAPGPVGITDVFGGQPAAEVAVGDRFACAVSVDGQTACWGDNDLGQLGRDTLGEPDLTPAPITDAGLDSEFVVDISTGAAGGCAVTAGGQTACFGQLSAEGEASAALTDSEPAPTATSVVAGGSHRCVLTIDVEIWCWGDGTYGQLGLGITPPDQPGEIYSSATINMSQVPAPITSTGDIDIDAYGSPRTGPPPPSGEWIDITGGPTFLNTFCGLTSTNQLQCFSPTAPYDPAAPTYATTDYIAAPETIVKFIDDDHAGLCGETAGATIYCWTGSETPPTPFPLPGFLATATIDIFTTSGDHHCAVTSDGVAACWGNNANRKVHPDAPTGEINDPWIVNDTSPLAGQTIIDMVASTSRSTCATTRDDTIGEGGEPQVVTSTWCWGRPRFISPQPAPIESGGMLAITQANLLESALGSQNENIARFDETCVITDLGAVACVYNPGAISANRSVGFTSGLGGDEGDLPAVDTVSSSEGRLCALSSDDSLLCWASLDSNLNGIGVDAWQLAGMATTEAVEVGPGLPLLEARTFTSIAAAGHAVATIADDGQIYLIGGPQIPPA